MKTFFVKCKVAPNDNSARETVLWGDFVDVPNGFNAGRISGIILEHITGIYGDNATYDIIDIKQINP